MLLRAEARDAASACCDLVGSFIVGGWVPKYYIIIIIINMTSVVNIEVRYTLYRAMSET